MKYFLFAAIASLILIACQTTTNNHIRYSLTDVQPASGGDKILKWQSVVLRTEPINQTNSIYNSLIISSDDDIELLKNVNKTINNIKYVSDQKNYGQIDYWATPKEFFEKGGDCEDYAIAKYFTLKELGISKNDMRIVMVFDNQTRLYHAILIVNVNDVYYMLDNQEKSVMIATKVTRYRAMYHINEKGFWL